MTGSLSFSLNNNFQTTERDIYLYGKCNLFAYALHLLTKLPIIAIVEERGRSNDPYEGLIHAFCTTEGKDSFIGNELAIDAFGITTVNDIIKRYCNHPYYKFKLYIKPDDVLSYGYYGSLEENADVNLEISNAKHYILTNKLEFEEILHESCTC